MKVILSYNKVSFEARIIGFLLIALLLLDRGFSKMSFIGPVYVHDLLLFFATLFATLKVSLKFRLPSILLLITFALFYFIYSIVFLDTEGAGSMMVFRHFFLFYYLICCYIIANKAFSKRENINTAIFFIIKIAKWSVILQMLYFLYLFALVPGYSPLEGFSYFSAVGVIGVITYGAYALVYFTGIKQIMWFSITLIMSAMMGHASSFFALFSVYLVRFYISFSPKQRLITLIAVIVLLIVLLQLPQFKDGNANWRLMYWGYILNNAIIDNFLVLGNGFGKPFMSLEFAQQILNDIGSHNMLGNDNPLVRWESPPHNSFLTMVFHVGFLPSLLILIPIKNIFTQIFYKKKPTDKKSLFLTYSLIGSIIWCSFNVILELPHSAIYFWLIYFTYAYYHRR